MIAMKSLEKRRKVKKKMIAWLEWRIGPSFGPNKPTRLPQTFHGGDTNDQNHLKVYPTRTFTPKTSKLVGKLNSGNQITYSPLIYSF